MYVVGGYRSDTGQTTLYRMAHNIHKGRWNYDRIIRELKNINHHYKDDARFERDFHSEDFYRRLESRGIKYLLSEYEIHLRENSGEPLPLAQGEILSPEYEVEHIWAVNTSKLGLCEDMAKLHEHNVHRLGNLTLASQSWNSSMGNKPFGEKRLKYANSSLRVQRELADLSEWNPDAIVGREGRIVEFALKRWSI